MALGELWEFTASAVGGKEIDSAILASAKSLRFLDSDNVSLGELIISFARILHERKQDE